MLYIQAFMFFRIQSLFELNFLHPSIWVHYLIHFLLAIMGLHHSLEHLFIDIEFAAYAVGNFSYRSLQFVQGY